MVNPSLNSKNPSSPLSTNPLIYPRKWMARKQSYTNPRTCAKRPSYPRRTNPNSNSERRLKRHHPLDPRWIRLPEARPATPTPESLKSLYQVSKIVSNNSISPVSANVLTNNAASLPALQPHRRKEGKRTRHRC